MQSEYESSDQYDIINSVLSDFPELLTPENINILKQNSAKPHYLVSINKIINNIKLLFSREKMLLLIPQILISHNVNCLSLLILTLKSNFILLPELFICFLNHENLIMLFAILNTLSQKTFLTIDSVNTLLNAQNPSETHQQIKNILYQTRNPDKIHSKILTVVFDIDGVLATFGYMSKNPVIFQYFVKHRLFFIIDKETFYILPGVFELLKLLLSYENVRVAFFSSGSKARNQAIVNLLIDKALGKGAYENIRSRILIKSRNDLLHSPQSINIIQAQLFGIKGKSQKKDITFALLDEAQLNNAIFFDDKPQNIMSGQEKNYVRCRETKVSDFVDLLLLAATTLTDHTLKDITLQKVNSLFYFCGVFLHCFHTLEIQAAIEKTFPLSFKSNNDGETYSATFKALKQSRFYHQGLEALQKVNPNIEFITAEHIKTKTTTPLTDDEETLATYARNHEFMPN